MRAPRIGLGIFVAFSLVAAAQCGGSCVDGVTPDCSDAQCGADTPGDSSAVDVIVPADSGSDASDAADAAIADADADG